jgi:hypothetical protein
MQKREIGAVYPAFSAVVGGVNFAEWPAVARGYRAGELLCARPAEVESTDKPSFISDKYTGTVCVNITRGWGPINDYRIGCKIWCFVHTVSSTAKFSFYCIFDVAEASIVSIVLRE